MCTEIAYADTCFDTGLPIRQRFATEMTGVAWLVEERREDDGGRHYWLIPKACRAADLLTWGLDDDNRSYRVSAVGADGSLAHGPIIEAPDPAPEPKPEPKPEPAASEPPTVDAGARRAATPETDTPKPKAEACRVTSPGAPGPSSSHWPAALLLALTWLGLRGRAHRQ